MAKRKDTAAPSSFEPHPKARRREDQKPVPTPTQSTSTSSGSAQAGPKQQQYFRFLDLPPELRNTIYESLFADSTTTIQPGAPAVYPRYNWRFKHQPSTGPFNVGLPALLAASKQLREGAMNIFCTGTEWVVRHYTHVQPLLTKLGRKRVALITSLCWVQVEEEPFSEDWTHDLASWMIEELERQFAKHNVDVRRIMSRAEIQAPDGYVVAGLDIGEYLDERAPAEE